MNKTPEKQKITEKTQKEHRKEGRGLLFPKFYIIIDR